MNDQEFTDAILQYIKNHSDALASIIGWWEERNRLIQLASVNPKKRVRLELWDFFFAKKFECELSKSIDVEIKGLQDKKTLSAHSNNTKRIPRLICASAALFGISYMSLVYALANYADRQTPTSQPVIVYLSLALSSLSLLLSFALTVSAFKSTKEVSYLNNKINELLTLKSELVSRLSDSFSIKQIQAQIKSDLDRQISNARSDLASAGKEIEELPKLPVLLTPAVVQRKELDNLLSLYPELKHHIAASRQVRLSSHQEQIYCVYRIDVIVPGKDILFTSSAYYDLIADERLAHIESDQYYRHISAITITRESPPKESRVPEDLVPYLTIELTSGNVRKFAFSTSRLFGYQPEGQTREGIFERTVKAIRDHIRDHQQLTSA